MRFAAAALLMAVAVAGGGVAGFIAGRTSAPADTTTSTSTVVRTSISVAADPGLPTPVAHARRAILAAAEARDYDSLRALIDPQGFSYTFGSPVEGGAVAHWRNLERTTPERPLEELATVLRLPYTLSQGVYVWPFVYDKEVAELTPYERRLLSPLAGQEEFQAWREFGGYFGWRAGIEPDGDWIFFIAGD